MSNLRGFLLLGVGYLLLFAAVYRRGTFALRPWAALAVGTKGEQAAADAVPASAPGGGVTGLGGPFAPGGGGGSGGGGGGGY